MSYTERRVVHGGWSEDPYEVVYTEELEDEYPSERQRSYEEVDAAVTTVPEHLTANKVYGVQTAVICPEIYGSLVDWDANPEATVWTMSPKNIDDLRHNIRTKNRTNATEEDFTGDLSRAIILDARLISTTGRCPAKVGFNMTGLEPRLFTKNNRYVWRVEANSGIQNVNESIARPNTIFDQYMLENLEKCDTESLNQQIDFQKGGENHALVDKQGYAWSYIMTNVGANMWSPESAEIIYDEHDNVRSRYASVPLPIAREVYDSIKKQISTSEESFVDMRNLEVKFYRDDGEDWSQINGLIGESAIYDDLTDIKLRDSRLNKPNDVGARIELKFVLF